jgi:protein-disulfide isomerase
MPRLPMPLLASVCLIISLAMPAVAQGTAPAPAPATPDKAAIEAIIRDYILKNPEIVQEAMVELERRQREAEQAAIARITANPQSPLYVSNSHTVVGNPQGDVTIVEFFDFNCGFCKRGLADLQKILDTDKNVRVILKEFPILSPGSREAALVALGLREQFDAAKLWAFHAGLLQSRGQVGKDQAMALAKQMGADMRKLEAAIAKPDVSQAIDETTALAETLGITGTPTYVVGENLLVGALGYDTLKERIANWRTCKKASC